MTNLEKIVEIHRLATELFNSDGCPDFVHSQMQWVILKMHVLVDKLISVVSDHV